MRIPTMRNIYSRFDGCFDGFLNNTLRGWVVEIGRIDCPVTVTVFVNGKHYGDYPSNLFREDLLRAGKGKQGHCAFAIPFNPIAVMAQEKAETIDVEIALYGDCGLRLGRESFPDGVPETFDLSSRISMHKIISMCRNFVEVGMVASRKRANLGPSIETEPRAAGTRLLRSLEEHAKDVGRNYKTNLKYRVVGHLDDHYSLSVVNRGIALSLQEISDAHCSIYHFHGQPIDGPLNAVPSKEAKRLTEMLLPWSVAEDDADDRITICHHYPPIADERPSRLRLAMFFWEESLVPNDLIEHFNSKFDGILVASRFVKKVMRFSGCTLPIKVVPIGVDHIIDADADSSASTPVSPGSAPYSFLHVSSAFARKGVDALLRAYFEEFSGDDKVELYIKTFRNPHNDIHDRIAKLRQTHVNPPNIVVNEDFMSEAQLVQLYRSCDAVVLPTRGEGFNLPAAEAMALGRPVIATGYSAHTDFLTDETGWSINYIFEPALGHLSVPDSLWVEPDVSHLKRLLRGFFEFDNGRGPFTDAEMKLDASHFQRTINAGLLNIRKNYRWKHTAIAIDSFAHDLLKLGAQRQRPVRVAWLSSWNTRCGIAEYSKHFVDRLKKSFDITQICDRRTAPAKNIYPLFDVDAHETLGDVHAFLQARNFDAMIVQYQPTFFDLSDDAVARLADIQNLCPVFLFFHSTKFLRELNAEASARTFGFLARLEGVFVHTLEDVNLMKSFGLVENVALFPHGVEADDIEQVFSAKSDREVVSIELARLDTRGFSNQHAERMAASLQKGEFWIGTFGFLLPHKRNMELLRALHLVHQAGLNNVKLLFLTAALDQRSVDERNRLIEAADAFGLSDDVAIVSKYLPIDQSLRLLQAADLQVFAYQNTEESASGAVRIALSTGKPVLTTPEPIFDALGSIAHRTSGWSAEEIAEAIVNLIRNPADLKSMDEARLAWLKRYSYSRLAERLSKILTGAIADFRLIHSVATHSVPMEQGSIASAPTLLCPPGIRYPEQGVAIQWHKKLFALDSNPMDDPADRHSNVTPDALVRWNPEGLWLEALSDSAEWLPLHLHPALRHCLDNSIVTLSEESRKRLPRNQDVSLFLYARRHGLRSILVLDSPHASPFAESMALADVILFANSPDRAAWSNALSKVAKKYKGGWHDTLIPQLHCLDESRLSSMSESATLRGLTIQPNAESNPLFAALRNCADAVNANAGREVFRFQSHDDEKRQDDHGAGWSISIVNPRLPRSGRRALGVVSQEVVEGLTNEDAVLSFMTVVEHFDLIIFTSSAHYQRAFEKICAHAQNIALTRRKCVLLERLQAEKDEQFLDRFCRALRVRMPLPFRLISKAFPRLNSRPFENAPKKLSVCVSTYNRAHWLRVTIPLLAQDLLAHRKQIEFIVVDNASTDDTEIVMLELSARFGITYHRNPKNVGMLGNLAVTAKYASGDYIWILGDDDLVRPGTTSQILKAIEFNPRAELIYMNYSYTHFDNPKDLRDLDALMQDATPIATPTDSRFHEEVKEFAARNENFFTAIYACVFRRDHALAAYCQFTDDPPFSTMPSCIPTTHYVLENMLDRPGFWIGSSQMIVNMNVSWLRYAPIWHMERLIEVFDRAEELGVSADEIMRYRRSNIRQALHFLPKVFADDDNYVANVVNLQRYIESMKRVDHFAKSADELLATFEKGRRAGRLFSTQSLSAPSLRSLYGIRQEN